MVLPVDQNAGALPRQTWIDVCAVFASVLRRDPPQEPAKDETAPLWPIALQRPSQWLNHQLLRVTLKNSKEPWTSSLSVYSRPRKRKEDNLNVRTSEVRWETLIYLDTFSLLAVTHLDTWLASSCTRAIIWSLLDLGATSDSPLAKLLMHDTTQCIVVLERDLFWMAS